MKHDADRMSRYFADPVAWRGDLLVRCSGSLVRFGDVMNRFQDQDFRAMDPAWERLLGKAVTEVPHTRAMEIRPRGHSKTQDAAVSSIRALAFSRKRLTGIASSGDKDQAAFLKDGHARLIADNPYLGEVLEVQRDGVLNKRTGSKLSVVSSDVATSWGHLFDYAILDELPSWPDAGEGLWHSLFSAADKQPNWTVLLVIGNAGFTESWQFPIVEDARTHDDWYYNSLPGPMATWTDEKTLARQRRGLPEKVFNRVWLNQWGQGSGGDALDVEDILACVTADTGLYGDEPNHRWIASLDVGIKKDRTAVCVLGVHQATSRIRLAACEAWAPARNQDVQLADVELAIEQFAWQYSGLVTAYDPHQAEYLAQRLRRKGVPMVPMEFTGANCHKMASSLLQTFRDRIITLYNDPALIADLKKLRLEERSYGFKLEASRNRAEGHADKGIALSIALALVPQVMDAYQKPFDDGLDELFSDAALKPREHYH